MTCYHVSQLRPFIFHASKEFTIQKLNIKISQRINFNSQLKMKGANWRVAIDIEIWELGINNTWIITSLIVGNHSIRCKWVYKLKYNVDMTVLKGIRLDWWQKGTLNMRGQTSMRIFSLVTKSDIVWCLLELTVGNQWYLIQLDVVNVFLHGDLYEEVYMTLLLGFRSNREH